MNNLRSIFSAIVSKRLAAVDLPEASRSHQHEINGVSELRQFFGTGEASSGNIQWHYFADDSDPKRGTGKFLFYDAREKSAARTHRTEWRMYYDGEFISNAAPGDVLVLAKKTDQNIYGLIFQENSAWLRSARILFGLEETQTEMRFQSEEDLSRQDLVFSRQQILEELGLDVELPSDPVDEEIASRELEIARLDGASFPSTRRMAELAQSLVNVDGFDADTTLISWLTREEELFRAMEKILVQRKLDQGFQSVDEFISYSLSIQNRRKSRMGFALQNHLGGLFTAYNLRFEAEKRTEGKNTPDFIFPGQAEYHDEKFSANLLVMLGAKSTCKDRWRQILTEAKRIKNKHLCTLEQAISSAQTDEMKKHHVTLVLPAQFHATYTENQCREIWTINQFIEFVRAKQAG